MTPAPPTLAPTAHAILTVVLSLYDETEYIALAESLVDEALTPLVASIPPSALPVLRDFLVDELLCTVEGQATLRRLLPRGSVHASEEVAVLRAEVLALQKKMGA